MITVGVTGGIGSGKTTICKCWETLGAKVIYADDLAKDLMVSKRTLKNAIIGEFGEESYDEQGRLNKAWLSRQAFELDKADRLNQLVHPVVYEETERIMEGASKEGIDILVKEAALLLLQGRPKNLDFIVLVLAGRQERMEWVAVRDETSTESVAGRMQKQQDFSTLKYLADFVIENDGTRAELLQKAVDLYRKLEGEVTAQARYRRRPRH
ncbi:MAG: dephospho-CoA kinase [Balneolales bacterium]